MIFRAKRTDNNEWIEGYYYKYYDKHYILKGSENRMSVFDIECIEMYTIIPSSLSKPTGLTDKHGTQIFGSIEVDGVMSRGGDKIDWCAWTIGSFNDIPAKHRVGKVVFYKGSFIIENNELWNLGLYDNVEIIGNQFEVKDEQRR